MKFSVCVNPYIWHGWLPKPPTVQHYKLLKSIGGTDNTGIRLGADMAIHCVDPNPETWDFKLLKEWLGPMSIAGLGPNIDINLGNTPAYASENQPAYIGSVAAWPHNAPDTPKSYGGTHWWNFPKQIKDGEFVHDSPSNTGEGIHWFDQDPNRKDSVTTTSGKIIAGPELAAIDSQMPARPYLKNPPHMDPNFHEKAAYYLAMAFYGAIKTFSIGNEYGDFGDVLMHQDAAFGGPLGDTLKRRMDEWIYPCVKGIKKANSRAIITGPDADSSDILDRYLTLDDLIYKATRPSYSICDRIKVHPYGDLIGGDYRTMKAFSPVIKKWKSNRDWEVGEIGGDPKNLLEWTKKFMADNPDCYGITYLDAAYFFEPGTWNSDKPVISKIGNEFKRLFAGLP